MLKECLIYLSGMFLSAIILISFLGIGFYLLGCPMAYIKPAIIGWSLGSIIVIFIGIIGVVD